MITGDIKYDGGDIWDGEISKIEFRDSENMIYIPK